MDLKYKVKKAWFGVWQKYKLEVQLKIALKLLLAFLTVWIVGSILTILSQWIFIDHLKGSPFQANYLKYFWTVIIELISGFDVQEDFPVISKIISVIMLMTGVIIVAIFTGQIVSMFVQVLQRSNNLPEKPGNFKFNRPIVICGVNKKLFKIIEELKKNNLARRREIVIVDEKADEITIEGKEKFKDVWYTKGDHADRRLLANVLGEIETSAIILAEEPENCKSQKYSDARAIETALAIEGYREKTHTVLELNDERCVPHLEHTKINEWISIFEYGIKLVSQTALQHGMTQVYLSLLGETPEDRGKDQICFSKPPLPEMAAGLTYETVRNLVLANRSVDITLIGLAKYVDEETNKKLGLNLTNTHFIRQLNPVNRTCMACGTETFPVDELGRVHRKCPACLKGTALSSRDNTPCFPKDTVLKKEDQLIYLSDKEIDFNLLFEK